MAETRYFTVVTKASRETVERYLYDHSRIVSAAVKMPSYTTANAFVIETRDESNVDYRAQYQADRLDSGMHAAGEVMETYQEAVDGLVGAFGPEVSI